MVLKVWVKSFFLIFQEKIIYAKALYKEKYNLNYDEGHHTSNIL